MTSDTQFTIRITFTEDEAAYRYSVADMLRHLHTSIVARDDSYAQQLACDTVKTLLTQLIERLTA